LRAIRLFASKVADSIAEGAQFMTDKQTADLASAAGAAQQAEEAAAAASAAAEVVEVAVAEDTVAEDISMEDLLGDGARKQPVAAKEISAAQEEIETKAY